jgi:hypothetical protein
MYLGYEGQDAHDIKGGMTVYYTQKDFNSSDLENYVTAFAPVSRYSLHLCMPPQRIINQDIGLSDDCR